MIVKNSEAPVTVVDQLPEWARTAEQVQTEQPKEADAEESAKED